MRFRKAVLKVGKYLSPDGEVDVTAERLKHWAGEFSRLKAAKQIVPIDWDHSSAAADLQPLTLDQYAKKRSAKNTVGHMTDFRVNGDQAELTLEVPDESAADKATKNLVYVSPVIFPSWKDGAGNEYRDCITHVDFVNHPVDHSQGPFVAEPANTIACALRMGLSGPFRHEDQMAKATKMGSDDPADGFFTKGGKVIPITVGGEAYLDDDHKPAKGTRKRGKAARSKRGKKKMGLVRMAEDELPVKDKEADDKTSDNETPETPPELEGGDSYDNLDQVLDLLEQHFNVVLPEDTDDDNLMDRLHTALLTAGAHRGGDDKPDVPGQQQDATMVADPGAAGAAALSLEVRGTVAWAEAKHRQDVAKRLRSLLDEGRCGPAEFKAREPSMSAVKLSLDQAGKPLASDLERWIESREAVPKGTFWDAEQRTRLSADAAPAPLVMSGVLPEPEVDEVVNFALGRKPAKS